MVIWEVIFHEKFSFYYVNNVSDWKHSELSFTFVDIAQHPIKWHWIFFLRQLSMIEGDTTSDCNSISIGTWFWQAGLLHLIWDATLLTFPKTAQYIPFLHITVGTSKRSRRPRIYTQISTNNEAISSDNLIIIFKNRFQLFTLAVLRWIGFWAADLAP